MKPIQYYRSLLEEYALDANNQEYLEHLQTIEENTLIEYAIDDAIRFMKNMLKKEPTDM